MKSKLNSDDSNRLFDIRRSLIEKFYSWDLKTFYALMLFVGSLLLLIITRSKELVEIHGGFNFSIFFLLMIGIFAFLLLFTEKRSLDRLYRLHKELIQDVRKDKLDHISDIKNFLK